MATTKVSALSALTAPDGAEELLINDGGTSKKITITNVSKLNLKGGDLTSASPLVIDTDGNYFDVTGTTNFAAMTVAANRQFTLQFDAVLTMTHDATDLDLPSEANITTAAGDVATFQATGANTVQCISYTRADGTAVVGAGYTLPEANATTKGGIELFSNTDQSVAATSVSTTASRTYGLQLNSDGQGVVNVPWVDTNTNTNQLTTFTVSATTDSNATTISQGDDLFFAAGTGITCTTSADGTVTIANTVTDTNTMGSGFTVSATTDSNATTITQGDDLLFTAGTGITCETTADGTVTIANTVTGGIASLAADTSPQLGGDLDCNGAQIQWSQGSDVASATALPLLTDGNYFDVTGTATVTSFNATGGTGTQIKLHFDAACTLTHNADIILPGGANIVTAAGDEAEFIQLTADAYRCTNYTKATGQAVIAGEGKQTIYVPANAMTPTTSNGCAAIAAVETTSGRPDMYVLDFDKDSDEFAQFTVAFPKSWNLGTVTYQVFWSGIAATTEVDWMVDAVGMGDNTTIDVVYGTAIVVTDAAQSAVEELLVSDESSAVTIAGTPADNDLTYFRIGRDVSGDDMAGDARLHGVKIFYTTDALNDA